jgi:hypothetical protein
MRRTWSNRCFVAACALVLLGVAPIAWLMGWSLFGNPGPVSMPVPVRPGNYGSPWFTTRINDLYELDLGTTPWRQNPVDLTWQIVDASGNILATGNWHDKTSGTIRITLARYLPKPGLRQRVLINIPHDVVGSEPVPTLTVYCPEAALDFSYEAPVAIPWAIVFLGLASVFFVIAFVPRFLHRSRLALS